MTIPSEPVSIAVAVVQHAGTVLIGRRAPEAPLGGLWEFPGGKVGPDETPGEAAARECREETGLAVRIGRPYPHSPTGHLVGDAGNRGGMNKPQPSGPQASSLQI